MLTACRHKAAAISWTCTAQAACPLGSQLRECVGYPKPAAYPKPSPVHHGYKRVRSLPDAQMQALVPKPAAGNRALSGLVRGALAQATTSCALLLALLKLQSTKASRMMLVLTSAPQRAAAQRTCKSRGACAAGGGLAAAVAHALLSDYAPHGSLRWH